MAELSCKCGDQKKTFKYLDKKDMGDGWECEKCPEAEKKNKDCTCGPGDACNFCSAEKEKTKMEAKPEEIIEEPKEEKEIKYDFASKKKRRGRPKKEKPE